MTQGNQKKKQITYANDNILEQLRSVGSDVPKTTIDAVGKISGDIVLSLLGGASSGELKPNQTITLGESRVEATPEPKVIPQARVEVTQKPRIDILEAETKQQVEMIRKELKAIAAALKGLRQEVTNAVDQAPVDPGIYHINFFEQLRSFLKVLRTQIEDSRSWLAASNSRKKKLGYWGMYKKHGTTFGLSHERSLATSAG